MTGQMRVSMLVLAAVCATGGLSACGSTNQQAGLSPAMPDEFRVMARAPLSVPPEYALRPPTPGEPRPQELQPESAARTALLGPPTTRDMSDGERLLLVAAGSSQSDNNIKLVIDDEFGDLAYKEPGFADRVMFWRKDKPETQMAMALTAPGASAPSPIDPQAEAARLQALTGGKPITITRSAPQPDKRGIKLPGM